MEQSSFNKIKAHKENKEKVKKDKKKDPSKIFAKSKTKK